MKKWLILPLLFLLMTTANARPLPDTVGVCYLFQGDELKDKDVCIISRGTGAGGFYHNFKIGAKRYLFEYSYEEMEDIGYARGLFYERLEPETAELLDDDEIIWCFKDKPYDICYQD